MCRVGTGYAYLNFFLWRFLRKRFLRLWVAILWRLRFLPDGMFTKRLCGTIRCAASLRREKKYYLREVSAWLIRAFSAASVVRVKARV